MSIETVKNEITRFLESETSEVMAIKGKWGTGKTYSWNQFLNEAKKENKIALTRYSYVSLFGVNSLDALKYAIFEERHSTIPKSGIWFFIGNVLGKTFSYIDDKIPIAGSILKFLKIKTLFIHAVSWVSMFFARVNISLIAHSITFASLGKMIICIDDLERLGEGLKLKDVLGLVSLLKEQRNCKVVLLLNEGEEGLKDYATYCEKVVDIELVFAPTAKENVEIAFGDKNDDAIKIVKESAIKLNIKNIRVLKQIERFVGLITPYLSDCEPEITQQVASSLTLFAWCHYCHKSDSTPPLDYLINKNFYFGLNENKNEIETEEQKIHKKWKSKIVDYGYSYTDGLNLLLIDVVKNGYVIEIKLKEELAKLNEQVKSKKSAIAFNNAWDLYYNSLENNENDVISGLEICFKNEIKYLSSRDLTKVVWLFEELGYENKAKELVSFYIKKFKNENIQLFNPKYVDDTAITVKNKFQEFYDAHIIEELKKETIEEVFSRIFGKNGFNPDDLELLANFDVQEYVKLFKSTNTPDSFIRTCLQFHSNSNYQEISNRCMQAAKIISEESKINELRLKRLGIS